MPISSTTSKTILMTPILTKKEEESFVSNTDLEEKKKLKINVHRPVWTRVVFDEEGNTLAPLAMLADKTSGDILLDQDIEGVVDSISSSWKSQGLALFQSRVLFNVVFHGRLS
ncbi:hypothetical protein ES332_D08G047200v1 [Gossypium tomentosum]|uniref:Uncharacterized protein n=1 Tax=Gossypium tomentosum TaxID=34277 RepID=A0A5D2JQN2_GOSTO|nr:hypothetical protein ES332_D08G047200v1 [Gossypium tomentosum]